MNKKILILCPDGSVSKSLQVALEDEHYEVDLENAGDAGLARAKAEYYDVVICTFGWRGSGVSLLDPSNGLKLVEALHADTPHMPIIVIASGVDGNIIIEATQHGAHSCIPEPTTPGSFADFVAEVRNAIENRKAYDGGISTRKISTVTGIVGNSDRMRKLFREIAIAAGNAAAVLIEGETGTGKELVARGIHARSKRAVQPFVVLDCTQVQESLFTSELHGHIKGAFTDAITDRIGKFEEADGGTLLIDEIGELPLECQAKLLRVLQEKAIQRVGSNKSTKVDVRVIFATNRDIEEEVHSKGFRQDLYFRICQSVIVLPPLRERRDDIPDLVLHFMDQHAFKYGSIPPRIAPDALRFLMEQQWPGNIRELQNVVGRALDLANGSGIIRLGNVKEATPHHAGGHRQSRTFEETIRAYIKQAISENHGGQAIGKRMLDEVERGFLEEAFSASGQNITQTAKLVGICYQTTKDRLERCGLLPSLPKA